MRCMKKWLAALLACALLSCLPLAARAETQTGDANLALDVMFVIDGSGSMRYSDPNGIAKEACKLFADMCDYEQARAGYVLFSSEITAYQPLTEMNSAGLRDMLRKAIDSIQYPQAGGTDISLGLTTAMNTLIESNSVAGGRSPMIVLLSDGCTEYVSKDRENIHEAEFEDTQRFLAEKGIPVYTIALNATGTADVDTLAAVAERTNGLFFETDTADNLSDILSQILANQLRSNIDAIAEFTGTGDAQTVTIQIPNDSIYQANIIILTSKGVSDLHLREPSGNEVVIPSDKVMTSTSACYQLVKILNPAKGDWQLTLTGVDKDLITINLINCYDMQFNLRADRYTVPNGDTITFDAYCSSLVDGEKDSSIFDGAEGILTIRHAETGDEQEVDLAWNADAMRASVQFTTAGNYTVSGRIIGKANSYDRPIEAIEVKVEPYPLTLIAPSAEVSKTIFSPFLGIKLWNRAEVPLASAFSWDKDATVSVTPVPGGWEDVCTFDYDAATGTATVSATKSGAATMDLKVSDSFGQSATYTIRTKIIPGWLPILLVLVLAGVVTGAVLIIRKVKAPYLKGTLKVSVVLPAELSGMTPPEAEIDLTALSKKGSVALDAMLASNLTTGGQYAQALSAIAGFVHKLEFEAGNADSSVLKVHLPAIDKAAVAQYGGAPVDKRCTKSLSVNMPVMLSYSTFGSEYRFTFTFVGGDFGGDFGGNDFGGFGGSNDAGGFGSFGGGGNDAGGFGSFGGSGNDAGGFGSFGGSGSDNSSFGGFGGGSDNSSGTNGGFGSF